MADMEKFYDDLIIINLYIHFKDIMSFFDSVLRSHLKNPLQIN